MTEDRSAFLKRLLDDDDPPTGSPSSGTHRWASEPAPIAPEHASYVVDAHWDDELAAGDRDARMRRAGGRVRGRLGAALGIAAIATRAGRLLVYAIALIGAIAGVGVLWLHAVGDPLADVHAYYDAATRLNDGQSLYPAAADPNAAEFYRYPPMLAVALRPLALLPYEWFALAWDLVVVASFVGLVWYLGARSSRTWLAIGILGVPIGWALSIGQAQVPMTMLVALGQPWSVALATNLKLFPALIVLFWLGRRDYQATIAFVLWTGLLAGAQLLLEPGGTLAFLKSVGLDEVGEVRNISPYAVSPFLWAVALVAAGVFTYSIARTKWGWSAAVALATLAPPRLLVYGLMTLLASVREPRSTPVKNPDPRARLVYRTNS